MGAKLKKKNKGFLGIFEYNVLRNFFLNLNYNNKMFCFKMITSIDRKYLRN